MRESQSDPSWLQRYGATTRDPCLLGDPLGSSRPWGLRVEREALGGEGTPQARPGLRCRHVRSLLPFTETRTQVLVSSSWRVLGSSDPPPRETEGDGVGGAGQRPVKVPSEFRVERGPGLVSLCLSVEALELTVWVTGVNLSRCPHSASSAGLGDLSGPLRACEAG